MKKTNDNFFIEVFKFSIITLLIVLPFRMYIAKPFIVNGESMSPTFENGNYLIVDQINYRVNKPQRGEVIVFKYPKDPSRFFIKRIIGLPNETVEIKNGHILIKREGEFSSFYLNEDEYIKEISNENIKYTVGDNEYFVMGDNRNNSSDSRRWGLLKNDLIIGRVFLRLFPIKKIGYFPGNFDY